MATKSYDKMIFRQYKGMVAGTCDLLEPMEMAFHDFYLIIYMAHGNASHKVMNQEYQLYEGDVMLVAPNVRYALYGKKQKNGLYYCGFYPETFADYFEQLKTTFPELAMFFNGKVPFLRISDGERKEIRNQMISMVDDYIHVQALCEYTMKCKLMLILAQICGEEAARTKESEELCANRSVDQAVLYIKRSIYRKVSLDSIARVMYSSRSYACRLFKKHMGMTITQFIKVQRVEVIKDGLANTDRNIDIIREDFDLNVAYLNRIFKEITGYTMLEYRAKYHYRNSRCKSNGGV